MFHRAWHVGDIMAMNVSAVAGSLFSEVFLRARRPGRLTRFRIVVKLEAA